MKGPGALPFLQKITSNNVAALAPGKVQYTCFPNEEGGIVDDLLVYQYDPQKYLLGSMLLILRKIGIGALHIIPKEPNLKILRIVLRSWQFRGRKQFLLCRN